MNNQDNTNVAFNILLLFTHIVAIISIVLSSAQGDISSQVATTSIITATLAATLVAYFTGE